MLFLAVLSSYFRDLGDENVLDPTMTTPPRWM